MTSVLLALALAAAPGGASDPCATVAPAARADPAAAAEYRAVGDAEAARGDRETAVVAYRAAAALDPDDAASRGALARLCAEGPRRDPFAEGVARLDAGDPRGALRSLRELHGAAAPAPAVALLEGICLYDLGEDAAAEALLRRAEASPAHRDTARLYLGLLRLRAGDASEAAALLDAAAEGPALAGVARDLARLARRDGRLVLSLLAESGWDSNVTLAPDDGDPATPGPEPDGTYGLTGALLWRPLGASGPYARARGAVSEQLSLGAYDLTSVDGAVGWQHRTRSFTLAAEYDLGSRRLGGLPYLTAHRFLASAVLARRALAVSVAYSARLEDYAGAYADFSGVVHRGELQLSLPLGRAVRLDLGLGGARDLADATDLSFLEYGPRAALLVAAGRRARVGLEAAATFRDYDAPDAEPGVPPAEARSDTYLDAAAFGEVDLGTHLTARLTLQGRRARSNVDALEYEKLVPFLGLLWVTGR